MYLKILLAGFVLSSVPGAAADEAVDDNVRQIEAEVAAYVEAFNAKDPAALSRHWSDSGVYVRPVDGVRLAGRKAIEQEFATAFAERPDAILSVDVRTIRFVTNDVAIEEGTAEVAPAPDGAASRTDYTAIHVKRDGVWQIDSIRETDLPEPEAETGSRLAELAWLVGDWLDASEDATVETSVNWSKNNAFLTYTFQVATGNLDQLEGTQVIGWNPRSKTIRSWMFDSDRGIGEGVWSRDGNQWTVKLNQILADGRVASSTNVYTYLDDDRFTWASIGREIDGEPLPDVEPVTLVRKPRIP